MRIAFVIRGLPRGGSERQLAVLAGGLARAGHDVAVVTYRRGPVEEELAAVGVRVVPITRHGRAAVPSIVVELVRTVRELQPDVVHSYLSVANVATAVLRPFWRRATVAWGVRATAQRLSDFDLVERLGYVLEPLLSHAVNVVIVNSDAGAADARRRRFSGRRLRVVHNGVDTDRFRPRPEARTMTRERWGIPSDAVVVGHVGRLHPMKDHPALLRAAALVHARRSDVRFVSVGSGPDEYTRTLQSTVDALGLDEVWTWAGEDDDMVGAYAAIDVLVSSSSRGEGFSNAIAEAMACGVPCVVTDVGDSAEIVGDAGVVVPRSSPPELASAILELLARLGDGEPLGAAARERIVARYGVNLLVEQTVEALLGSLGRGRFGRR